MEEIDSYTNSELITNDPHSVVEMQVRMSFPMQHKNIGQTRSCWKMFNLSLSRSFFRVKEFGVMRSRQERNVFGVIMTDVESFTPLQIILRLLWLLYLSL